MAALFKKDNAELINSELLKDISKDSPTGANIRNGSEYASIKQLRLEDDYLPQGIWKYARKEAEWRKVEITCMDILKNKSKDSQVLIWLFEAWGHLYGSQGLLAILDLANGFFKKYWVDMYPKVSSEEDWEYRQHLIQLLDDKLVGFLKRIVIINPTSEDCPSYTLAEYTHTINKENSGNSATAPDDEYDKYHFNKILHSASLTSKDYLAQVVAETEELIAKCDALNTTLNTMSDLPELELFYTKESALKICQIAASALEKITARELEREAELKAIAEAPPPAPIEVITPKNESVFKGQKVEINDTNEAFEIVQDVVNYLDENCPDALAKFLLTKACVTRTRQVGTMSGELTKYNFEVEQLRSFLGIKEA